MSESSDEEFDGFSQNEVDAAAQRYNDRLAQIGIGELDVVDNENESENDFSDENEPLVVDEAGDRPAEADGWHENFNYYERGLPHIFLPRGNTGPTTVLDPDKEPVDFFLIAVYQCHFAIHHTGDRQVYSGRINGVAAHGLANRVVKNCIEKANVIGQGYHIYMDNYFTSPTLFTDLFEHSNTAACGTVRINRRELPKDIMKKNPEGVINRGDMQFRQKDAVAAVVWKDKKKCKLNFKHTRFLSRCSAEECATSRWYFSTTRDTMSTDDL
ncbi:unnamed protein product [Mytilus edulis]|uniref:PiggyBac transposable element-derived protein domain-containing protein n=1 Tax=Mytilus edulis TaxID=6550 RepID=A0A8S3QU70_MYTED|nr:unnamed protein product [Mytilus edulis]